MTELWRVLILVVSDRRVRIRELYTHTHVHTYYKALIALQTTSYATLFRPTTAIIAPMKGDEIHMMDAQGGVYVYPTVAVTTRTNSKRTSDLTVHSLTAMTPQLFFFVWPSL